MPKENRRFDDKELANFDFKLAAFVVSYIVVLGVVVGLLVDL